MVSWWKCGIVVGFKPASTLHKGALGSLNDKPATFNVVL